MPGLDLLERFRRDKLRVGLGAVAILLIGALAVAIVIGMLASPRGSVQEITRQVAATTIPPTEPIFVHVVGAVASPGLYQLGEGSRVIDLIFAAGGFSPDADPSQLNLAQRLQDEEQLRVPKVGETLDPGGSSSTGSKGGKVNLNTADAALLETLPHVGPALAARIISWRSEHGRFRSIEDLLGVSGIGPKTFEDLKNLITV